jgi:hypothetical protein
VPHHNKEASRKTGQFQEHQSKFEHLDWTRGYSADDLRQQFSDMPADFWSIFPIGRTFYSFEEFWRHTGPGLGAQTSGQMRASTVEGERGSDQMGGNR